MFQCFACGLHLKTHAALHFAGLGDSFLVDEYTDPSDFYGLAYASDEEGRWEYEEYMNE